MKEIARGSEHFKNKFLSALSLAFACQQEVAETRRPPERCVPKTLSALAVLLAAACASAPAHATEYLRAIEDVPLASGLVEEPEPVVFESDLGRVVRTRASGNADYGALREFYLASLPPLGWARQGDVAPHGPIHFVREHEILTVSVEPASGVNSPVGVIFELVVKLAPSRLPD